MNDRNRGAEAYRQAHQYIAAGNPGMPGWQLRRLSLHYLRITASPPLTWSEKLRAWRQSWTGKRS